MRSTFNFIKNKRRVFYWTIIWFFLLLFSAIYSYVTITNIDGIYEFCLYSKTGCGISDLNTYVLSNKYNYKEQVWFYLTINNLIDLFNDKNDISLSLENLRSLYKIDFNKEAFMQYAYLFFSGILLIIWLITDLIWFPIFLVRRYRSYKLPWKYCNIYWNYQYYISYPILFIL